MNNEYNDYQILSPSKMEEVAKKYSEKLKGEKFKEDEEKPHSEEYFKSLCQLKHTLGIMYDFFSRRRKKDVRLGEIKSILEMVEKLTDQRDNTYQPKKVKNYYEAVKVCLTETANLIDLCVTDGNMEDVLILLVILKKLTALV